MLHRAPEVPPVAPVLPPPAPGPEKSLPKPPPATAQKPPAPKPPMVTEKKEPEKPKGMKPPEEQKRRFARTSEEQAGKPTEPTDILGERDTAAASELPPDPSAKPNTPSQDGVAPLFPGQTETVDSTHKDGSVGMDKKGKETETPQEATARKDSQDIDDAPKVENKPLPEESSSAKPKNKHLEQGTPMPASQNDDGKKNIQDEPKAESSPKEKPNKGSKKEGSGDATEQDPKKDGFRGHSKKNKITGSISRRGKSALNVKNSPLGRYQALVSKAVELQWRRNCEQHRDHIVPGVVSVRFYVDKNGKVSGVKFQEVVGANLIETGFTQRAIRQASLPKMSKSVLKELKGEPLELIYNFYF